MKRGWGISKNKKISSFLVMLFLIPFYLLINLPETNVSAQSTSVSSIPSWIKNNAKWWSEGQIADSEFIKGIQYLIQQGILTVPLTTSTGSQSSQIPNWVKKNAGWWADGQLSDDEFIKGLQYLVSNGIINPNNASSPTQNFVVDLTTQCHTNFYYDTVQHKCLPIGGSDGIIAQPQAKVTDNQGTVSFQINGQNIPFQFYDEKTGLPVTGLKVGFALDPETQSSGVLLAIDPNKKYPLQAILIGSEIPTNSTTPTSWFGSIIPHAYAEESNKIPVSIIPLKTTYNIELGILPWHLVKTPLEQCGNILDAYSFALVALNKIGALPAQGLGSEEYLSQKDASSHLIDRLAHNQVETAVILVGTGAVVGAGVAAGAITAPAAATVVTLAQTGAIISTAYNLATFALQDNTRLNCSPDDMVRVVHAEPLAEFIECAAPTDGMPVDPVYWSNHNPFKASLDLISTTDLGYAVHCEADPNTNVSCPAAASDYYASISAPGMSTVTQDVSVSQGTTTTVDVQLPQLTGGNNTASGLNTDPASFVQEGNVLLNQTDYQDAIDAFNKALSIDPNNVDAYVQGCFAYGMVGNFSEAKGYCLAALKIDPNNVVALVNMGFILDKIGYFDQAIRYFNEALRIDPNNSLAQQGYGMANSHQSKEQYMNSPQSLSSTLSAAGDLTGTWGGTYSLVASAGTGYGACSGTGSLTLQLTQSGNTLAGYFITNGDNPCWEMDGTSTLQGSVSSSSFTFTSSDIGLTINQGRFTSNTIGGNGFMNMPGSSGPFSLTFSLSR